MNIIKFVALPVGKGGNYGDGFWQVERDQGQELNGYGVRFTNKRNINELKELLKRCKADYRQDMDALWREKRAQSVALTNSRRDRAMIAQGMKFIKENQLPLASGVQR